MIIKSISEIASQPLFYQVKDFLSESELYMKIEGLNIAGSIKLTTAKALINNLLSSKHFNSKTKVIESSSGNLGVALSIVCKEKNIPFICVVDPNIADKNKKLLSLYGTQVIQINQPDANGGFLGTRIKTIEGIIEKDPNTVWVNQYANLANPRAHFEKTAKEIAEEFPKLDYLFIGAGTTGTLTGCAAYFKINHPQTKIIGVDAKGSITFGGAPKKRFIPGIGTSRKPPIASTENLEQVVYVDEKDGIAMCRTLLRQYGLFVGGSTGSVMHAVRGFEDSIPKGSTVLMISPDFGDKYLDSVYDDHWVRLHYAMLNNELSTNGQN